MTIIDRAEAKSIIVSKKLIHLFNYKKLEILERYYPELDDSEHIETFITEGDLPQLSEYAIQLIQSKQYLTIPFHKDLNPLFKGALFGNLYGVTNDYLELLLNNGKEQYKVIGDIEPLGQCPCCNFYSIGLGEDGFYDICTICFWENGGNGPNHMTLEEAKQNFKTFGALSKSALQFIDAEGKIKYKQSQ
jgi:hypothetical protein